MVKRPTGLAENAQRRRSAQLASEQRAGAHSRRVIRQRHRQMIRDRWCVFAAILAIGAGLCAAAQLLLWDAAAPYLVGAITVGTIWACHEILISVDGLAAMRVGILGEEWTTSELRKLNRHGWRFVNHVMLEWGDIDHALLGPGASSRSTRSTDRTGATPSTSSIAALMMLGSKPSSFNIVFVSRHHV